ncbi:unnamed protein product [Closterium sp. Naga37s-1]|nr:unnamed protein product [Closterium sp. Naga37s-1]
MLSAEDAARSGGGGRNVTASARGGGKGGGAAGVGQSQACGSRGATDGGPDGDESEWSAALMDPSRSDRRSSTGDRRRSSRLSASSRRRNAMEYSELDAIRERLLHATQLWAITVADSSTDGADSDAAAALAAAETAVAVTGAAVATRSAASGTPAVTATSCRSMSRSLSAAGFAGMTVSEATASAAMLAARGAAPGKAAGASTNLTLTLPGASSSQATGASGIPDSTTPTGPTFTFGPTDADDVSPTSAAAPSDTSSSSLSASAHGLTCSGSSPPHVAESPFSRISTFLMRRFVSPFPILGLPVLSLDLSLRLRVRAQNPNYMPVSYSAATVAIYYDGTKIGESNMGAGQFMPRDNKVMELSATMSALELAAANARRLLSDMVNRSVTVEAVTSFPAVAHGLCDSLHPRLLVELRNEVTFDPLTLGVQESDSFSAMQLLQPITHPMHADSVSAPSIPSPMEPALLSAISAIHAAPARAVLAVTGGASQAVGWLVAVPGASQTVLEAVLPYSQRAFDQYVDATWHAQAQQYVSRAAAQQLAFASYNRALSLAPIAQPVVGVGCTCALVSSAPKRGAHRCHIAARSQGMLWEYSLLLSKEALRSRQQEDDMASRLLIRVLAASMGLPAVAGGVAVGEGRGDGVEEAAAVVGQGEQIQEVLDGRVAYAVFAAPTWASRWGAAGEGRRVVLCGSFNPLHQGHTDLMAAALLEVPGGVPCYEMAAWNADKGAIPVEEVERRVHQFTAHGHMVVVTRLPLFASKASLFPHSTFVIGYDTAVRLLDAKYYGNSHSSMMNVLHGIARSGCDFLVAGRLVGSTFQVAARQAAAATATAASDDAGASESSW